MSSSLERTFDHYWNIYLGDKGYEVTPECLFSLDRNWRFDRAVIARLCAFECNGGGWVNGRHGREIGMSSDFEKYNSATLTGWRIFFCTTSMLENDPDKFFKPLSDFLSAPILTPDYEMQTWVARVRNLTRVGDAICNNGITVTRIKNTLFRVEFASGVYEVGKKATLDDARQQVLHLILKGKSDSATPSAVKTNPRSVIAQRAYF